MHTEVLYEIKKSKFIGYAYRVTSEAQAKDILSTLAQSHKKATHICYAYTLCDDGVVERCSDDGEPSGTAGRPILNVIKHKNARDTLVVVVRYFGGVKLGAGGLLRAYTKCASMTLAE